MVVTVTDSYFGLAGRHGIGREEVLEKSLNLIEERLQKLPVALPGQMEIVVHVEVADASVRRVDEDVRVDVEEKNVRNPRDAGTHSAVDVIDFLPQGVVKLASRRDALHK